MIDELLDKIGTEAGIYALCVTVALVCVFRAWQNERKESSSHNMRLWQELKTLAENAIAAQTKTTAILDAIQRDGVKVRE